VNLALRPLQHAQAKRRDVKSMKFVCAAVIGLWFVSSAALAANPEGAGARAEDPTAPTNGRPTTVVTPTRLTSRCKTRATPMC